MEKVNVKLQFYKPMGARLLVEPVIETLSLEERGKLSNIHVVVEQEERPRPTTGIVVALGPDPLLHENVKVGDKVFFYAHAGHNVLLEDKEYRSLELQDLTGVISQESEPTESGTPTTAAGEPSR